MALTLSNFIPTFYLTGAKEYIQKINLENFREQYHSCLPFLFC